MKPFLLSLLPVFGFLLGTTLTTQNQQTDPQQQEKKTKPFMRAKLVGSQSVLDGLVSENFGLIRRGAENMKQISEAVQWPRAEDPVYDHFGDEFRRQCDTLVRLAENNNLEGAHYTYLNMTTTCINCHNYVRDRYRVEQNPEPHGPVRLIPTEWPGKTRR